MRRIALISVLGLVFGLPGGPSPAVAVPPLPNVFMGGMHTHTGYSDGMPDTTPADAYARARDEEHLDFLAVTEHSETLPTFSTFSEYCLPTGATVAGRVSALDVRVGIQGGTIAECALIGDDDEQDPTAGPVKALNKWNTQRKMASAANRLTPKPFLALRGFEWSSDVFGHINVYFSRNYSQWLGDGGMASKEKFYQWLQTPAALGGGADALATFNHPGAKTVCNAGVEDAPGSEPFCQANPLDNWNHFEYRPELDDRIVGIEIYNRSRNYESYVYEALDKGWHLGVIGAEDIHETDWGAPRYAKTGFLAPKLTPIDLKEAMKARRTFATLDHAIRINFTADGQPMGSRIPASEADLTLDVTGGDVAGVEILTGDGNGNPIVVASAAGRTIPAYHVPAGTKERWFLVRVTSSSGQRTAYSSPIWVGSPAPAPFAPRWVSGDFHVHTTYSHDVWEDHQDDNTETPAETYTFGWTPGQQIMIAESRGLDFVALTDHNDVRATYDPGYTSDRLTLIPSYENSLAGHAQMVNTDRCLTPEGPTNLFVDCNSDPDRNIPARVEALADVLRDGGGAFQINHPSDGDWVGEFGGGTGDADNPPIVPDSIEVWNIGPWHWQQPAPSANDNDFSLEFWQTYLDAGIHVAATGGSDNHWRSTTAVQGVGQPTTWVYVTKPGAEGIIEGVRMGRTTVSAQPPAYLGPRIYLEADEDGDGTFESMVGDTVTIGKTTKFRWRLENAPPNSRVNVVSDGYSFTPQTAPDVFEFADLGDDATWVRLELVTPDERRNRTVNCDPAASTILDLLKPVLEPLDLGGETTYCRNRLLVHALTSPIYLTP